MSSYRLEYVELCTAILQPQIKAMTKAMTKIHGFAIVSKLLHIYSRNTLAERHLQYFSDEWLINSCYKVFFPQMKIKAMAECAHG